MIDTTNGGMFTTDTGGEDHTATPVAVQQEANIAVTGFSNGQLALARHNACGSLVVAAQERGAGKGVAMRESICLTWCPVNFSSGAVSAPRS